MTLRMHHSEDSFEGISPSVEAKENRGIIFDIQPYSVHDGPGIRTLLFLKGCPLNCIWCSNPESQQSHPQLVYRRDLCKPECGNCEDEYGQIRNAGKPIMDNMELPCCPNGASTACGREYCLDEVMEIINRDRGFFGETGGITLSGGEPFCQPQFAHSILERCRESGINTAVESSLYVPFPIIETALPHINFFMFDIKLMNPKKHRRYCGVDNHLILDNISRLAKIARIPLLPRMPLIPGINVDDENIKKTGQFLAQNDLHYINILPYMRYGIMKYEQVGKTYKLMETPTPSDDVIQRVKAVFYQYDVYCL